ncbi:MAG: PqqD family protein [Chloroflexi bacterium]|nr:PqqD family protein [Chloroflexota bacterium]
MEQQRERQGVNAGASQIVPMRSQGDQVVAELGEETVVYDQTTLRAHALNRAATYVWQQCDGRRTVAVLAEGLERDLGIPAETGAVWVALDALAKAGLLAEPLPPRRVVSRRQVLKAAGKVGLAASLVPAIASITAPTAAAQSSCKANGAPCTTNTECCSGFCGPGVLLTCQTPT